MAVQKSLLFCSKCAIFESQSREKVTEKKVGQAPTFLLPNYVVNRGVVILNEN